jgi:hypothetical protein
LLRPLSINAIERLGQPEVRVAYLIHDGPSPVEVLLLSRHRPIRRRIRQDVAQIAVLVRDLDLLRVTADVSDVLDLPTRG